MYTKIAKVSVNREKTVSSIGKKMWERGQKSSGKPFFDFFPTNPFPIYSQYADLYDRKTFHKSKNQKKMKRTATTFVFSCLAALTATAQTVLPDMKTADDFGGQVVTDLGSFVPNTADYTLEVLATAGTTVNIGFGQLSYTPTVSGTVRFVQQDGHVYVFENNAYTTRITPTYDYAETGENLLRNPSFENVSDQFTSGRWKATDWETWNGGTQTWGGDVGYVNVRENASYCSDGTKSIILHSESRWLGQQLTTGVLQTGKTYRLSYDFWTSEGTGNGGTTYRLQLGAAMANNSVMDMEGHTTVNGNTERHSFDCVFQLQTPLPDELYLSFYRSGAKVDWLDNLRLIEITPKGKGITGTPRAIYATGAYAPASVTLPLGTYIDMTARMKNPNFEDGTMTAGAPIGWILDAQVTQSKISTVAKGGNIIAANQNHWQLWQAAGALTGRAYQELNNLPGGKYRISAVVSSTGFGGNISLYANYGKTAIVPDAAKSYEVTGIVVNGNLEFGLKINTTSGMTIDFDTFTLHYLGMDADGYREVLAIKIAEAKTISADHEEGYDPTPLNEAVTAAEALTGETVIEDIAKAIADIDAALSDYRAFADAKAAERARIERYEAFIAAAKQELSADNYPGSKDFEQAIAIAEKADRNGDLTPAIDALNAAREAYYNSQFVIEPIQQMISYVDLSLNGSEKFVLRVDGKPFYATEIQVRPDKLRGYEGWNEQEIEAVFKRAADDGFSTLSVPLFWSEVELQKNHFDWRILDRYMGWCKKYGLKMELLWFSWSSGGRVQYLWNHDGKKMLRTPDYVCSMEGTSEYNMLRKEWEYSLDWRDTNLRDRETYVLGRVMEHVALWDANNGEPHTVIGVQLGNEASTHGSNTATDAEIITWYHNVGSAVKQSKYVVWTRLNCVSWMTSGRTNANEIKRNNGGTNIDFVGIDIYGTNASKVKGNMDGLLGTNGKNYRMIMEIDAKDGNSPIYQLAALAGDKAFDYYNMGPVDGNGLYAGNGHALTERAHIALVRQRNAILNADMHDIALKSHGKSLYVYNYAGNTTSEETGILSISYTPADKKSQGIAINRSNYETVLMSTGGGSFAYPLSLGVKSAEVGYFDNSDHWVKTDDITFTQTHIILPAATCVRLLRENAPTEEMLLQNGEFETDLNHWYKTFDTWTYKVSTVRKGDGSIIGDGEGHMQIWNDRALTGRVYQDITLPDGIYTLRAGIFATFEGKVSLYAGENSSEIADNVSGWYEVTTTVTDGHLQVGLNLQTTGVTDIELDHVTLTKKEPTTNIEILSRTDDNDAYYSLDGRKVLCPTHGIYIHKGKKVLLR